MNVNKNLKPMIKCKQKFMPNIKRKQKFKGQFFYKSNCCTLVKIICNTIKNKQTKEI